MANQRDVASRDERGPRLLGVCGDGPPRTHE
jgi:hypothetical protein